MRGFACGSILPSSPGPAGRSRPDTGPVGHPLADEVADAAEAVGAVRPVAGGAPYGSDLRLYAAAGVPTLRYGPGDVRLAHSPRESVDLGELVKVTRALGGLAVRRLTTPAP